LPASHLLEGLEGKKSERKSFWSRLVQLSEASLAWRTEKLKHSRRSRNWMKFEWNLAGRLISSRSCLKCSCTTSPCIKDRDFPLVFRRIKNLGLSTIVFVGFPRKRKLF
jgi:hypothetical protein